MNNVYAGSYRLLTLQKLLFFFFFFFFFFIFLWYMYIKTYDKCSSRMPMTYIFRHLVLMVYQPIL